MPARPEERARHKGTKDTKKVGLRFARSAKSCLSALLRVFMVRFLLLWPPIPGLEITCPIAPQSIARGDSGDGDGAAHDVIRAGSLITRNHRSRLGQDRWFDLRHYRETLSGLVDTAPVDALFC
jgi:hypothetical protein